MLAALPWFSLAVLCAPVSLSHPACALRSLSVLAQSTADTDTVLSYTVSTLSSSTIAPYVAVEQELDTYWHAHPALAKKAQVHGHMVSVSSSSLQLPTGTGTGTATNNVKFNVLDYPGLAQKDTAIAAIFDRNHYTPTQFVQTQVAVRRAIDQSLDGQAADSTTIEGKNITVVQAHRSELTAEWEKATQVRQAVGNMIQQMMSGALQHYQQQQHNSNPSS